MSHTWMSHATHMSETRYTVDIEMKGQLVLGGQNESCVTHGWVMSHTWMSHVTHMNEPGRTADIEIKGQLAMVWADEPAAPMRVSCHTYGWVMSHVLRSHVPSRMQHTATHCNTLHHTAPHCNALRSHVTSRTWTLQHAATHCNTWITSRASSQYLCVCVDDEAVTRLNQSYVTYE